MKSARLINKMNEIILLGMQSQLDTRNKIILESRDSLADIVPLPIAQLVIGYVSGDYQYIHLYSAYAFLNGHYEASQDDIGVSIETSEPDCCHSCCESVLALNISVTVHDWDDNTLLQLNHMWNYIVSSYDDAICGCIADIISSGKADRHEDSSYSECKRVARALLDSIRQQIITAGSNE